MRKKIVDQMAASRLKHPETWLDLEQAATVEITSEDPHFPAESVFQEGNRSGWRAGQAGEQRISLIFDHPMPVRRIRLRFVETEVERTQEFTIRWSGAGSGDWKEVVRQQWNFNPANSTCETEDYQVNLDGVSALELSIKPDVARGEARATLAEWRIA